jgi:hypothetical protein
VILEDQQTVEYRCPGESSPISRGLHLGRLARFYPACRRCSHRDDTGTLSPKQVERLAEARRRDRRDPLFHAEGAAGVYLNDLDPKKAGRMAAALGVLLVGGQPELAEPPVAVIAPDGRPLAPEILAAVGEGLRWAGCNVVEIGPATAASTAFAVDYLQCAGGILVGNPLGRVHTVGLKFWAHGARPVSQAGRISNPSSDRSPSGLSEADYRSSPPASSSGADYKSALQPSCATLSLNAIRRLYETGVDRPTRKSGGLERFQAEPHYLEGLADHYHALRPLRFALKSGSPPVFRYL